MDFYAQDFGLPALRCLAIWNDPFTADFDLTNFPCLEQIKLLNEGPFLHGRAGSISVASSSKPTEVLSTWDLEDLYCHKLQLSYLARCCSISLRDLGLLPYLQKLTLRCPMQLVLEVPVKVVLTEEQGNEPMSAGALIPLSRIGHLLIARNLRCDVHEEISELSC